MSVSGSKKRVRKEPDVRRAEIMDAASRIFSEKGYRETTVDDIVREAGIGKGTFYLYFESKPQVLAAIGERIQEGIFRRMEQFVASHGDARARLYVCMGIMTEGYRENMDIVRLLNIAGPEARHERLRSEGWEKTRGYFKSLVQEGIEAGSIAVDDVDAVVDLILAIFDGVAYHILLPQSSLTMESAVKMGRRVIDAILPRPGADSG